MYIYLITRNLKKKSMLNIVNKRRVAAAAIYGGLKAYAPLLAIRQNTIFSTKTWE